MTTNYFRRLVLPVLAAVSLAIGVLSVSISAATLSPAQAQVSAEFQAALEAYGTWQPHPRFGEVWVPYDLPPDWRPYTYGRWVYTDDWGWYWVSDDDEADWGWVTFHYGRWAHDQRLGWFWVPGDEWGPAWVDWRRGDDFVGWAPLPPDDVIAEYDSEPAYWIFVQPRYLIAPRVRTYFLPPQRSFVVFRRTVIVNRTVRIEYRDRRGRIAVNPGVAPGIIAAATHQPVHTFRVQPRVVAGTQGVAGAVQVRPQDLSRGGARHQRGQPRPGGPSPVQATLQPTQTVVQPLAKVPQPQALRRDEHGRLGSTPPRAAQGATVAPPPPPPPPPGPKPPPPPSPPLQNGAPRQPNTTTPPTPPANAIQQPPRSGPSVTTPPGNSAPVQRQERREERRVPGGPGSGGPPPQQPTIVRPIPPQAPPPPPPPQQRQVQPPPPPPPPRQVQPPPPVQRQVQPPPPVQRQVQPPPQAAHPPPPPPPPPRSGPPPKKPPPKPGEKPADNK
ncbi:MAG TPA: DUF6600 domain-containing protein [Pseudolabrys sp.]|nr:DUF6600 domain-containing protein [Pseudolabrys sp.]